MASCLYFVKSRRELWNDIERLDEEAESTRISSFLAARKIQSWYRGIITRNHLRKLNAMAIIIQRHWRGFRARINAKNILIRRVEAMWQRHYDESAKKIQKAWRRYRNRANGFRAENTKTGFRARDTKNWMGNIHEKNKETIQRMRSYRKAELEHVKNEIERESLLWILFILFKLHHLLGTKACPGVLKSMDQKHCTKIEKMIKCLEYSVYVEKKRLGEDRAMDQNNCNELTFMRGTRFERCERAIRDYEKISQRGTTKRTESKVFRAEMKSIADQVDNLARTLWGDNYQDTISCSAPIHHG